jgi:hypothetical protein
MVRPGSNTAGRTVAVVGAAAAIAIIGVLSVALVADSIAVLRDANATRLASAGERTIVNRANKTNALVSPQGSVQRIPIKTVEVVGIRNAAIVYRDRDGNILFRTDPVANVTVVAKNVDLPEVTIRDTAATEVKRMSVGRPEPTEQPQGCESAFARPAPTELTRISSRCLADIARPGKIALVD